MTHFFPNFIDRAHQLHDIKRYRSLLARGIIENAQLASEPFLEKCFSPILIQDWVRGVRGGANVCHRARLCQRLHNADCQVLLTLNRCQLILEIGFTFV